MIKESCPKTILENIEKIKVREVIYEKNIFSILNAKNFLLKQQNVFIFTL